MTSSTSPEGGKAEFKGWTRAETIAAGVGAVGGVSLAYLDIHQHDNNPTLETKDKIWELEGTLGSYEVVAKDLSSDPSVGKSTKDAVQQKMEGYQSAIKCLEGTRPEPYSVQQVAGRVSIGVLLGAALAPIAVHGVRYLGTPRARR